MLFLSKAPQKRKLPRRTPEQLYDRAQRYTGVANYKISLNSFLSVFERISLVVAYLTFLVITLFYINSFYVPGFVYFFFLFSSIHVLAPFLLSLVCDIRLYLLALDHVSFIVYKRMVYFATAFFLATFLYLFV